MIEIKQISSYIMDSGERLLIGGERKQVLGEEERALPLHEAGKAVFCQPPQGGHAGGQCLDQ